MLTFFSLLFGMGFVLGLLIIIAAGVLRCRKCGRWHEGEDCYHD
jgi:hypothetical protein